jgi:deazaflavin-dependent oxidoreductase (nitroreductase family)
MATQDDDWDMPIVVPPRGTRGSELPGFVRALMRVTQGPYQMAFRRFGDRMRVQGRPLVGLETVGARSGSRRQAVLGSFPEIAAAVPSSWVVVAANAGSARHPAWLLNLAKNPDQVWITSGKRRVKVRPETLEGAERDRAWQEITSLAPGYGRYVEVTDRVIPIVRLRQEAEES